MADDLVLKTGGYGFGGWKSIAVQRGMEQCAGAYRLVVSERWAGQSEPMRIVPGHACQVLIGNVPVITGYVDAVDMAIDGSAHEVQVAGRDATADLVDCSAVRKTGQWRGLKIEQIAQELAQPFGVAVRTDVDTGRALQSFALQEGESVFEAIERAARIRALLLVSDGNGALVITRAGTTRVATALVLGENLLSARATLDLRDRYSQYVVKGQAAGSDYFNGTAVSQIKALASDPGVPRYRPLVLTNDCPDIAANLKQRAQWEANVRAARSTQVDATVQGWQHAAGLWQPNTLVRMVAEPLRLDDDLLISGVQFNLDERGSTTTLTLTRADAFTTLAVKQPAGGANGASWWHLPKVAQPDRRAVAGGR